MTGFRKTAAGIKLRVVHAADQAFFNRKYLTGKVLEKNSLFAESLIAFSL